MNKVKINEYVTMYQFPFVIDECSVNVSVVFNEEGDFVLIDSGFEHNMEELKKELDFSRCKYILITHHHSDHVFGVRALPKIDIIGHKDYLTALDDMNGLVPEANYTLEGTVPTIFMEDNEELIFGNHAFKFIHHPLHTQSSMLILLNDEILFTGDELLFLRDGQDTISAFFANNELSDKSYDQLIEIAIGKTIVPGHGNLPSNDIKNIIDKKYQYISLVKKGVPFNELRWYGFDTRIYEIMHNMNLERHS